MHGLTAGRIALSAAALSLGGAPSLSPMRRVAISPRAHATARGRSSAVQHVYDMAACGDLESAAAAMDLLSAADCGLHAGGPSAAPGSPVCYHHIHSDAELSIGIFVLPPGASLPLHDHPGMTVLSKLLFGSLDVTSFDAPSAEAAASPPPLRPSLFGGLIGESSPERLLHCAAPSRRVVSAPSAPLRLEPTKGNIHAFVALEHTAIFDVLTPPYNEFEGRSCHYYEAVEEVEPTTPDGGVMLREVPWPDSLRVVNRPYTGARLLP